MKKRPAGLPRHVPKKWWKWEKRPGRFHVHKSLAFWRWRAWRLGDKIPKRPKPKPNPGLARRAKVVAFAHTLVGIHEVPDYSNSGPDVHRIQSATGAYGAPWCVSTVQYIWKHTLGSTYADDTAGAYYLADYAARHSQTISRPVPGCAVVYHIGQGHAGTVISVGRFGSFTAIEGNEGNAVRVKARNTRQIRCTFILRPELR
jgi:hypothetical protein